LSWLPLWLYKYSRLTGSYCSNNRHAQWIPRYVGLTALRGCSTTCLFARCFNSLAGVVGWWRHLKFLTIQQAQPRHPGLGTYTTSPRQSLQYALARRQIHHRCCTTTLSAASCHRDARDGDLRASAGMVIPFHPGISQTWHVHVAVLPRRHSRPRRQGQGKGSRSMRVESSRILGESSSCNSAVASLIQTASSSLETIVVYDCHSEALARPVYRTTFNLQEHHLQPDGILRIRQPPSWFHTSRTTFKTKPWATSTPASPPPAPWLVMRWAASEDSLKTVVAQWAKVPQVCQHRAN
jgi:hypothetical protein